MKAAFEFHHPHVQEKEVGGKEIGAKTGRWRSCKVWLMTMVSLMCQKCQGGGDATHRHTSITHPSMPSPHRNSSNQICNFCQIMAMYRQRLVEGSPYWTYKGCGSWQPVTTYVVCMSGMYWNRKKNEKVGNSNWSDVKITGQRFGKSWLNGLQHRFRFRGAQIQAKRSNMLSNHRAIQVPYLTQLISSRWGRVRGKPAGGRLSRPGFRL